MWFNWTLLFTPKKQISGKEFCSDTWLFVPSMILWVKFAVKNLWRKKWLPWSGVKKSRIWLSLYTWVESNPSISPQKRWTELAIHRVCRRKWFEWYDSSKVEMELLRAQNKLFAEREQLFKKHIGKNHRKLHGIVIAVLCCLLGIVLQLYLPIWSRWKKSWFQNCRRRSASWRPICMKRRLCAKRKRDCARTTKQSGN